LFALLYKLLKDANKKNTPRVLNSQFDNLTICNWNFPR